jgi:hypothetical protein
LGSVQLESGLKHFKTTAIIESVQPEYGLKQSMTATIIGLHPARIRPKPIYDDCNYWAERNIKWAIFDLWRQGFWCLAQQEPGLIHLMMK